MGGSSKKSLTARELSNTDGNRYQVYNLGIGGDTSRGLAARIKQEIEPRVSQSWQNIILIAIGINDSRFNGDTNQIEISLEEYEANLEKIISIAQDLSRRICFVGITPVAAAGSKDKIKFKNLTYTNDYENNGIEKYDEVLGSVASKHAVPKVNIFDEAKNGPVFMNSLQLDQLHPDSDGHAWLHERIEKFILELLKDLP